MTEKVEPHYKSSERNMRYLESFFIILPLFAVVFIFFVIFYNLTGIITVEKHGDNVFLVPFLAELASPGAIFDANSNMAFIPSIAQVVLTMILNKHFRELAKFCTDRENHKYQSSYENSLIVKRCLFEFSDCFLPLIYLGWWERNFKILR